MKRQGVEGFTWDSKAEEWLNWALSCIENDKPKTQVEMTAMWKLISQYALEMPPEHIYSPAQRDLTTQPYSPPTRRKTPSYGAAIGVCGLVLVAVAFWIWG